MDGLRLHDNIAIGLLTHLSILGSSTSTFFIPFNNKPRVSLDENLVISPRFVVGVQNPSPNCSKLDMRVVPMTQPFSPVTQVGRPSDVGGPRPTDFTL